MEYNFDRPVDRRGTYSTKWSVNNNELPMWIADMDFQTAPAIVEAIQNRTSHGVFGYTHVPKEWYQAIISWWSGKYDFPVRKEWLMFCTGVVPAISAVVRKLTTVGENIVIQTPVYHIFFNSILNNGRNVLENQLLYDGKRYSIDFTDLEEKLSDPQTTMMILCNPHNPTGNIWDSESLERIGELCWKYSVTVLSDEIHGPLTEPGFTYIPFASVSRKCRQNSVTCIAPTKAFNLAGLQTAAVIVPDEKLWHKVNRGLNTDEVDEPNVFAVEAAIAAFTKGDLWLSALRKYISGNRKMVNNYLNRELPEVRAVEADATYLVWLDCSRVVSHTDGLCNLLKEKTGLCLSPGDQFGGNGRYFLRMNIACQREKIEDALVRLKAGIRAAREQASEE